MFFDNNSGLLEPRHSTKKSFTQLDLNTCYFDDFWKSSISNCATPQAIEGLGATNPNNEFEQRNVFTFENVIMS